MDSLDDAEWDRTAVRDRPTRRPPVLGTDAAAEGPRRWLFELRFSLGPTARRVSSRFTEQRTEIARARKVAESCAERNP